MPDIAVIVVNWNAREDLRSCLSHLFADPAPRGEFAVWVIDNASSDRSAEMVASEFPQVHLIANPDNRGFSRANNQGIDEAVAAGHRYVYLLNSDAFLQSPRMLDKIVEFGDQHPEIGIFGTKVINPDGSIQYSCRRFPTLAAGVFRNTLLGKLFPGNKYAGQYLMYDVDHDKPRQVDWVSGCSMVIKTSLIREIGALDERFFMYCEDVDICRRSTDQAGLQIWYMPDATVIHKIGASSDKNAEKMIWEFHRSWELYVEKHYPGQPVRHALVKSGLWLRATIRILNRRRVQWMLRSRARQAQPQPQTQPK